jgi:tetratricopeptide (TPR) repeat protein
MPRTTVRDSFLPRIVGSQDRAEGQDEQTHRVVRGTYCFGERFEVESLVGIGGMGMVFRGRDRLDGQAVALKVLHHRGRTNAERFLREAEALAALSHPAIVRYVAHGVTLGGEPYLAMEWIDGETLADRLCRGAIGAVATARLGSRMLQALAVAHERGIVHCDVKPSNLFLPEADLEQAKLLDFGIARWMQGGGPVTRADTAVGTPMYMAPEQALGANAVDGRADIFSLGCVLYECATGKPLQPDPDSVGVERFWDRAESGHSCESAPKALQASLAPMLVPDPMLRSPRADELAIDLASVAKRLGAQNRTGQDQSRHQTLSENERRLEVAVVVVGVPGLTEEGSSDANVAAAQALLARHGARAEQLADGSTKLVVSGQWTPIDRATQAARVALRLGAVLPEARLGIGTNRADSCGPGLGEDTVKQTASLLANTPPGTVALDALSARLLENRFEIQARADGTAQLRCEKGIREAPRTLMGKEMPCFGRNREIGLLESLWHEACDEPAARVLLITGNAGSGKSRVRFEFCDRIQRQGRAFELLIGCGDPMRDAAPFSLLGPALLAWAGVTGGEPESVQRQRLTAHVARFLPAESALRTAVFLGEMANLPFPDEALLSLRAAREDPRLMADQMLVAWMEWLEAECDHQPMLLVLEDLHWGDLPSVNFVDAALRVLADKPFMVLALARPEVDQRFPSLWQERNLQRVNLTPLSSRSLHDMITHGVGTLPDESARWIAERSQGNPLFVQELLRVVAGEGKVGDDSSLPTTILGVVQARFDLLGADPKLVLRAGSIFGRTFRPAGVKALLDKDRRKDATRWLEILSQREVLFARGSGDNCEYAFRHAIFRQAAYELLPPEEKCLGHLLAGQYLEQAGERDGLVLAHHFGHAGDKARAIRWLGVAAEQAMDADDLAGAIDRIDQAVKLGAAGEELYAMRVIASQAHYWRGEYLEATNSAREALLSAHARIKLSALSALFDGLGPQAKYGEIAALFANLERPAAPELLNPWLDCMLGATAYLAAGGDKEIRGRTLALLEEYKEALAPHVVGQGMTLAAHVMRLQGNPMEAAACLRRAVEYFESIGHHRNSCMARGNLGVLLGEIGQLEEGEACLRQLLATARKLDMKHLIGGTLQGLANILAFRGRLDEARALGEQGRSVTIAQNDRHFQGSAEAYLSVTEYLAGDYPRAEHFARAALATWKGIRPFHPFASALVARALLAQGHASEALLHARDAYAELERLGAVYDGEATIRLALVECLIAVGDVHSTQELLDKATTWLHACASNIGDPALREAFLTRIPDNRRILELARDWATSLRA